MQKLFILCLISFCLLHSTWQRRHRKDGSDDLSVKLWFSDQENSNGNSNEESAENNNPTTLSSSSSSTATPQHICSTCKCSKLNKRRIMSSFFQL